MDTCSQRINDPERELICIDHLLLSPNNNNNHHQLVARRAELFVAIMREDFLLTSYGGMGQHRNPDPRASVAGADCIIMVEKGLLLRLQGRARYVQKVVLQQDLKDLEEERLDAMACGDMQELFTLDAEAAKYCGKLEDAQNMLEFVTHGVDELRHLAARQCSQCGAPILLP